MGTIYLRTNTINGMQYVGQAKNFKKRQYSWNCIKYKYGNQLLTDDRNKYGVDNFKTTILQECDDSELDRWEKHYIKILNTTYPNGYNDNAGGTIGFHHSQRVKDKISEANKGHISYNKGKTIDELFDEEKCNSIRKKLSDFGKTRTGEKNPFFGKKFKIHPMQGKHHTDETKKKISEKNKNGKLAIPIVQIKDDGEIINYPSSREAARNGYDCGSISRAIKGEYKKQKHHYKGSLWYKKEDYEKMLAEQSC